MNKKYDFINESIDFEGRKLYRIRAIKDFGDIKKGDLGGFIENEDNLSHYGECWVYNDAKVMDMAEVEDNAIVKDNAVVRGRASIVCDASVSGNALIKDEATIGDDATVTDNAIVSGGASVVYNASVSGNALITDSVYVDGNATVTGNAKLYNECIICDNAIVGGSTVIFNHVCLSADAKVDSTQDYVCLYVGRNDEVGEIHLTYYNSVDGDVLVGFDGNIYSLPEFEDFVNKYIIVDRDKFLESIKVAKQYLYK